MNIFDHFLLIVCEGFIPRPLCAKLDPQLSIKLGEGCAIIILFY